MQLLVEIEHFVYAFKIDFGSVGHWIACDGGGGRVYVYCVRPYVPDDDCPFELDCGPGYGANGG